MFSLTLGQIPCSSKPPQFPAMTKSQSSFLFPILPCSVSYRKNSNWESKCFIPFSGSPEIQRRTRACSGIPERWRDRDEAERERMLFFPACFPVYYKHWLSGKSKSEGSGMQQPMATHLSENPSAATKTEMITVDRTGKLYWGTLSSKTSLELWEFTTPGEQKR